MIKLFSKKSRSIENEVLALRGAHEIMQYAIDNGYQPSSLQSSKGTSELVFVKKDWPTITYNIDKGRARVLTPDGERITLTRLIWLYLKKANEVGYEPSGYYTAYAPYFIQKAYGTLTGKLLLSEAFQVFYSVTCPEELLSITYTYKLGMNAEIYARRHGTKIDSILTKSGRDYYSAPKEIDDAIKYAVIMTMYLEQNVSRYELNEAVNHGYEKGAIIPNHHFLGENKKDIEYVIGEFDLITENIDKI